MDSLIARLGLDKTGFDAGMAAAGKQVNKFGGDLKSSIAGGLSIAAVAAFTKELIRSVSHINDLSERLGVSAETLQEMEYAAKQTGQTIDDVAGAFRALSKARLEAMADPNSKAGQVFASMGISNAELRSQSLEQTFKRIADVVKNTNFGASELAMVQELLGRSAGELIPMFKAGIENAAQEARNLGLIIAEDIVVKIDDAGDAMDRFATRMKSVVAPAVGFVADRLRDVYDLADVLVGNVGAIAGSLLGGSSLEEARQAGREHVFNVINRREQEDAAAQEKAQRRKAGAEKPDERIQKAFEFAPKEEKEKQERLKQFKIQETAFGRIGAFTGAAAMASMPPGQAQQIQQLQKIHDALARSGILIKDVR